MFFFSTILIENLHLKFPFQNLDDVKIDFLKIKAIAELNETKKTIR